MLLEEIILSYSIEMIYEESGDFWDLLKAQIGHYLNNLVVEL